MHFITSYTEQYVDKLLAMVTSTAQAGVDVIQFSYPLGSDRDILELALQVREITASYDVKMCVNNRLDIANAVKADYLHIGQTDIPIDIARQQLDDTIQIGLTVTDVSELHAYADYYGVGPIFTTNTKDILNTPIGIERLQQISSQTSKPIVAIGGITSANYKDILQAGATDAAIIGDLYRTEDIEGLVQHYNNVRS